MLRQGVIQEWVDEGEFLRERTKNRRWRRPYDVLAEATHGEVVVRVQHTRICMIRATGELDCFSTHIRLREPDKLEDKAKCKSTDSRAMGLAAPWYHKGIGRKRGRGGGKCKGKLQVPRQGRRAEAKELYKISINGLLIKIAESEGLWIDTGVLDQGTK
ncbi:hypothetical protein BHE74_00036741 [Ensete ventricosum]|nr:hypothetical protein BHE74_00036741 [Ensete ventricosum]RZS20374.1 hypothetical protein BHM03_00052873 [Ensete ventricosum]